MVFFLALIMRVGHLQTVRQDPVSDVLILDSLAYDSTAGQIAFGNGMPAEVYFQAPTYPYFLAAVYRVAGHNLDIIRLIQIIVDAVSALLIMAVAANLMNPVAGIVAGIGMAIYPVLIFQSCLILKTTFTIFLVSLMLALMSGRASTNPLKWGVPLGIVTGLAAATQGSFILQIPLIGLWIIVTAGIRNVKKWVTSGLLFGLGLTLVIAPIAIRNYRVSGERVLLTAQGGANFYLGNSPFSDGTSKRPPMVRMTPEYEQSDFHREAEVLAGRKLTAHEASSFWFAKGMKWIREHPVDALHLQLRKLGLFWNRVEIPDNYDFDFYRNRSPWIRYIRYPFLIVGILGLYGMLITIPRFRITWLLHCWVISYCLIVVAFHVYSRYRLPVVAFLWPFAGYAMDRLVRNIRAKSPAIIAFMIFAVLSWFLMSLPLTHYSHAQTYFNRGSAFERTGRETDAVASYRAALQVSAEYVPAMNHLARIYFRHGRVREAKDLWETALRLKPDSWEIMSNLGVLAVRSGDYDTARRYFEKSIDVQPFYFHGWLHLAQLDQATGNILQASTEFRRAVDLDPSDCQARFGLATVLDQMGASSALDQWKRYVDLCGGRESEREFIRSAEKRIRELSGEMANE